MLVYSCYCVRVHASTFKVGVLAINDTFNTMDYTCGMNTALSEVNGPGGGARHDVNPP